MFRLTRGVCSSMFALCVLCFALVLLSGTASAQGKRQQSQPVVYEFAAPKFVTVTPPQVVYVSFPSPKFSAAGCSTCTVCECQPGQCAAGACGVKASPAVVSKYANCPECVEAEMAYRAKQAAKASPVYSVPYTYSSQPTPIYQTASGPTFAAGSCSTCNTGKRR